MNIRAAVEPDIPALQTLLRNSWLTTWAPELTFATVQRFAATDPAGQYASGKWREFFVAEERDVLLGMFHVEADYLHAIHLDPKNKRRRIGSTLMDEVERLIGSNYSQASLDVLTFNTGAVAFYHQRGWVVRRRHTSTECGEPVEALEMVKPLRPGLTRANPESNFTPQPT